MGKLIMLAAVASALGAGALQAGDDETHAAHMERMRTELLRHINEARVRQGLGALETDRRLMVTAQGMAQRMAIDNQLRGRGNAEDLMRSFGWIHFVENTDATDLLSPRELVQRWLEAHPFRGHVLDAQIHLGGVGIQATRAGRIYVAFNGARHRDAPDPEPVTPPPPRTPQPPSLR